jgi:hypothetical protein
LKKERRADEAVGDELAHVAHRRTETEGEADARFEAAAFGEIAGTPGVAKVVRDRLFAEHVLAGFERRPGELEVVWLGVQTSMSSMSSRRISSYGSAVATATLNSRAASCARSSTVSAIPTI